MPEIECLLGLDQADDMVDHLLVAAGKAPTVDIGLENAGVAYTPKGIDVDDHLQTSVKHISASGDAIGRSMYTHVGVYESKIVAHNLLNKGKLTPDYRAIPRVTFLSPEVASVGLSEEACLKRDLTIKTAVAPINIIGRANVSNIRDGFVKVITDKKGILLGASVVAPHAGEPDRRRRRDHRRDATRAGTSAAAVAPVFSRAAREHRREWRTRSDHPVRQPGCRRHDDAAEP